MRSWWKQWLFITPGVFLAAWAVDGFYAEEWPLLLLVGLVLAALNIVLKPILILFALPFVIFTLGLGIVLINALLVLFAGAIVPGVTVAGFWSAFWAGVIVSLVSILASALFGDRKQWRVAIERRTGRSPARPRKTKRRRRDDDVIDV
ncbi:MAG: phage holin family protein [Opitutales bacterium]